MIELGDLTPSAMAGWLTLFELCRIDPDSFLLIGGQMMHLLAVEHGAPELARPTQDVDVVVDVRARPGGTAWLAAWLCNRGFELAGASPQGIGHRFVRRARHAAVQFDVLAPEGLAARTDVSTVPPARTVAVPGSVQAFERSEVVGVAAQALGGGRRRGRVRRPNLLGALIVKAAATRVAARADAGRDWQDAALLLSLIEDPLAAAAACGAKDHKRLAALRPLAEPDHAAWALLGAEAWRRGSAALDFLLDHR